MGERGPRKGKARHWARTWLAPARLRPGAARAAAGARGPAALDCTHLPILRAWVRPLPRDWNPRPEGPWRASRRCAGPRRPRCLHLPSTRSRRQEDRSPWLSTRPYYRREWKNEWMNPGRRARRDGEDDTNRRCSCASFGLKPRPRRHIRAAIGDLGFPLCVVRQPLVDSGFATPPMSPLARTGPGLCSEPADRSPANQTSAPPDASPRPQDSARGRPVSPHQIAQVSHWL